MVLELFSERYINGFMRKIVFAINITTDGYCSHTDMIADEELHRYFTRLLHSASLLLYGRITYQLMVPFWPDVAKDQSMPEAINEFARVLDSLEKIIFSTTLKHVEGTNSRLARADLAEEVLTLKQQPGKDICVGSLSIASQLSERHLIDEYRFVVHPVVAGKGPRLFDTMKLQETLRLDFLGSETLQSGVVALHYKKHT
ncbi:riboflavin biosynthesis protein RibD C-terminal domain protein [Leptospira kirschneri str. 200803703]|uniref:dihydrofolate reductase family protein n=1 Tax=Leptospira kirschneri TaxID=29507 RepID=UPI0002BFF988|nr:dihydrofolate reductase family protein [Leptospira kirschneri]EMO66645.1 riboflavin biosynthesis protein RibD C-terminal domain protein [Leptospira kirschneri str. 200803703]